MEIRSFRTPETLLISGRMLTLFQIIIIAITKDAVTASLLTICFHFLLFCMAPIKSLQSSYHESIMVTSLGLTQIDQVTDHVSFKWNNIKHGYDLSQLIKHIQHWTTRLFVECLLCSSDKLQRCSRIGGSLQADLHRFQAWVQNMDSLAQKTPNQFPPLLLLKKIRKI